MAKFKNVVNHTRQEAWFLQKAWVTPKLIALVFLAVAGQAYPWAYVVFLALAVYWGAKLVWGLFSGKYTGIR